MSKRTIIHVFSVSVIIMAGLLFSGCAAKTELTKTTTKTELTKAAQFPKAPDPGFMHMDGSVTTLADYSGKSVVVVNFWGLRCQNCIEEMPFLERLHNKYGSKGLVILGINTDGVPAEMLTKLLPQLPVKFSYPIIVDPEFTLADAYQMMAAPLTLVIGKDGTVRFRHEGYEPAIESKYIEIIEKLL